jgi:hypothetical protein
MKDILVDRTMQEARKLIDETVEPIAWEFDALNKPLEVLVKVISSSPNPTKLIDLTIGKREHDTASILTSIADDQKLDYTHDFGIGHRGRSEEGYARL